MMRRSTGTSARLAWWVAGRGAALALASSLALFAPRGASAQSGACQLSVETTTPAVGQPFRIDASCQSQGAQVGIPELDLSAFEVMSRQQSQPMQFSFGFGNQRAIVESSSRLSALVVARREGRFEIGPASVRIGGQRVSSQAVTITVVAAGSTAPTPGAPPSAGNPPPPAAPPGNTGPPSGPLDGAVFDDQAFLRTIVDRRDVVVGEQITVTFYLYVRSLASQPQITQQPATDGFWVHDLLDRNSPPEAVVQRVGSANFRVYTLRRIAAFPLRAGELSIGAMEMQIPVGSPLDALFGSSQGMITRTSTPVTVTARALPSGATPGIPTHVGALSAEASLDRAQVPTGDAVTFELHLTGVGQIDAVELPRLAAPGLRVLQPETQVRTTMERERVGGDRRVRWLLVPERPGDFTLGPFRWSVYDPASGRWSVVQTEALTLTAAGNAMATPTPNDAPDAGTTADAPEGPTGGEFGPVRTSSSFSRRAPRVADSFLYRGALAFGPSLLALVALGFLVQRRGAARARAGASDRAAREARALLADAEAAIASRDTRAFYATVTQALRRIVEVRLERSIGSLTHAELRRELIEAGMADDLAIRLKDELEGAEMARFSAAGGEPAEMGDVLARARAIFLEVERFTPRIEEDEG